MTDAAGGPLGLATPVSGLAGIEWPAVPPNQRAGLFALLFQLERSQWAAPEALLAMQMRQLEILLAHAAHAVPFWGERLRPLAGLSRGELRPEHLRELPVLGRAEVQDAGTDLVSPLLPDGHGPTADVPTTGSTGRPVVVKQTKVSQLFYNAFTMRMHLWHGRDFDGIVAALLVVKSGDEKAALERPVPWAAAFGPSPSYRMDVRSPIAEQVRWLRDVDPHYIVTYPSNAAALAEEVGRSGRPLGRLGHVATLGEIVRPEQREACRRHLGVDIVDTYSSMEAGVLALQCPGHAHYLVQSEGVYLEVVDEGGRPCRPGEVGRVLVTVLHNFAFPLIRYEIGDYAEVAGPCPTGRGLPALARIVGRVRNMLVLPSGDRIWPSFPAELFLAVAPVRQIQLVQHAADAIEVKLAMDGELTGEQQDRLRDALAERLRHPFRFTFTCCEAIPLGPGHKYEDFVCKV